MSSYIPPSVIVNGTTSFGGNTGTVSPATIALIVNMGSILPTATVTITQAQGNAGYIIPANAIQNTITATQISGNTQLSQGSDYTLSGQTFTLESGQTTGNIQISYQWVSNELMTPTAWNSSSAVENYYGTAFNTQGQIINPISAGAIYAFGGGASSVIILPYYAGYSSSNSQPATVGGTTINWVTSFPQALGIIMQRGDVDTVVPVTVSSGALMAAFPTLLSPSEDEIQQRMICAWDNNGSAGSGDTGWYAGAGASGQMLTTATQFQSMTAAANSPQIMVIGNSWATNTQGQQMYPSMYACAIAGMTQVMSFNQTLTHAVVPGFALDHSLTPTQMNQLAECGCTVISAINGKNRVRQALCTVQNQSLDWNYGAVFNYICSELKAMFEPYIGKPQNGTVLNSALGALTGFLSQLENAYIIAGYQNASVSYSTTQQGTMLVSFEAAWLSPINYILVNFTFDTNSGGATNSLQVSNGSANTVSTVKINTPAKKTLATGTDIINAHPEEKH